MKELLLKLAYWILKKYNIRYFLMPSGEVLEVVKAVAESAHQKFSDASGEYKRNQVLRSVMNILPNAKEREINLAIEMYISERNKHK